MTQCWRKRGGVQARTCVDPVGCGRFVAPTSSTASAPVLAVEYWPANGGNTEGATAGHRAIACAWRRGLEGGREGGSSCAHVQGPSDSSARGGAAGVNRTHALSAACRLLMWTFLGREHVGVAPSRCSPRVAQYGCAAARPLPPLTRREHHSAVDRGAVEAAETEAAGGARWGGEALAEAPQRCNSRGKEDRAHRHNACMHCRLCLCTSSVLPLPARRPTQRPSCGRGAP